MLLLSTLEYLQAFRSGDYLRFLEWPQFIAAENVRTGRPQDGEAILEAMTADWLRSGFYAEDLRIIELLYAIHEMEEKPLRGIVSFALINIIQAALNCTCQVHNQGLSELDTDFILFSDEERAFFIRVGLIDRSQLIEIYERIRLMCEWRNCVDDYLSVIQAKLLPADSLQETRISLIKSLAQYLNKYTMADDVVKANIARYVRRIQRSGPAEFELEFLNVLPSVLPKESVWDTSIRTLIELSLGVFSGGESQLLIEDSAASFGFSNRTNA